MKIGQKRKRGHWQALKVSWRIALKGVAKKDAKRAMLTAELKALRGESVPFAHVKAVTWQNPDAPGKRGEPKTFLEPADSTWLTDQKFGLPTLNRGGWLESRIMRRLTVMGGEYSAPSPAAKPKRRAGKPAKRKLKVSKRRKASKVRKEVKRGRTVKKRLIPKGKLRYGKPRPGTHRQSKTPGREKALKRST